MKQRFIQAYELASAESISKINIKRGFRGAGIFPTCVNLALQSYKSGVPQPNSRRPKTPEVNSFNSIDACRTPYDSRDFSGQALPLQESGNAPNCASRFLMRKAGKTIDQRNGRIARLATEKRHRDEREGTQKLQGRKAIDYDPNETFACIESIAEARDAARRAAQRYRERYRPDERETSRRFRSKISESMQITFQIE